MTQRTLLVMRHAKAAWPDGVSDLRRPLAPRGRADAAVAADYLSNVVPTCPRVLVSPALRTEETWSIISPRLGQAWVQTIEEGLYEASVIDLFQAIRAQGPECEQLLIIGHNPGCAELTTALQLDSKPRSFPTSAIAQFTLDVEWSELEQAELVSFVVPRALRILGD